MRIGLRPIHLGMSLALLCAGAWAQPSVPGRIVDRVVAVVDGQVITQSELEFEARVALVGHGAAAAATETLDDAALRSALDLSINQRLQEREAEKLKAFPVERGEIEAAYNSFRERFLSSDDLTAFLNRQEADESQLLALLERGLRAEKMLDSKLKLRSQVSEAEVRSYYDQNARQFTAPYSEVRASLREKLFRDRYSDMAAREMASLRLKADVRSVAPFAGKRPEAGKGK